VTVRVATVLSARVWEPSLVAYARESAAIRIVTRAYQPEDVDRSLDEIDVVVTGGEVTWVTPSCIAHWRERGVAVIGVAPPGDGPAARLLETGGANEVVPDTIDTSALVQAIRFVAPARTEATDGQGGRLVGVVAPRGAPGATEVAVSYALDSSRHVSTVLIDLDVEAPAVAIRLGIAPRPDLTDVADAVRAEGSIDRTVVHRVGRLEVITGSHRQDEPRLRTSLIEGVLRCARHVWDETVVDLGSSEDQRRYLADADEAILVVDGSASGIVRAAQLVSEWRGPAPALVLNRVESSSSKEIVDAARRWIGLDPAVVIPERRSVRRSAWRSAGPDRKFARAISELGTSR